MLSFRGLSHAILMVVVMAVGVLRLDIGVAFAQVEAHPATPPLIEEVSRLVGEHFYDRGAVERVWAEALAAHTAALPADASSEQIAAAAPARASESGSEKSSKDLAALLTAEPAFLRRVEGFPNADPPKRRI
jgi:hypothetical protein